MMNVIIIIGRKCLINVLNIRNISNSVLWNISFFLLFFCFVVLYFVYFLIVKGNVFLYCVKYLYFCDMFGKDMEIN